LVFHFSSTKSENKKAKQALRGGGYQWEGERGGERMWDSKCGVVYILCTLVCKCKMRSVETIPGRRDKWSRRGGEFKYDVFDTF
jgi:hypothetical protein